MKEVREKYKTHIAAMFRLAGSPSPKPVRPILDLETSIAKAHISLADSEDIHKANNPGIPPTSPPRPPASTGPSSSAPRDSKESTFIVWQPSAFTAEAALVASQPIDAWKDL